MRWWPAARKSRKVSAPGPRSPMANRPGSDVGCARIPLARSHFIRKIAPCSSGNGYRVIRWRASLETRLSLSLSQRGVNMSAPTRRFLLPRHRGQRVKPLWRHWRFCCRTFEGRDCERDCERQRATMPERGTTMSYDRSADGEAEVGSDENEARFVFE